MNNHNKIIVAFLVLAVATDFIRADCDGSFIEKLSCNVKYGVQFVGNKIADGAEATIEGAESLGSSIVDGVKDGAVATKDGVITVGEKVIDLGKDGYEVTKDGVQNLGGKIANGAVSAKDSIKDLFSK